MGVDLDRAVIFKPWGYEYLFSGTAKGQYGAWTLHLREGKRTSAHFHTTMNTVLYVISGKIKLEFEYGSTILREGDRILIPKGRIHRMGAIVGDAIIIEIETPSDKLDSVRLEDDWARLGSKRGKYAEGCKMMEI